MAPKHVEDAAERLRAVLEEAKASGSYRHGWYAYMARWDIETLIDHVLGPEVETSYLSLIPRRTRP